MSLLVRHTFKSADDHIAQFSAMRILISALILLTTPAYAWEFTAAPIWAHWRASFIAASSRSRAGAVHVGP